MKLLIVSSEFPPGPGGIGVHAHHLAAQLTARGWQVGVLTPQDYASAEEIRQFNESQPYAIGTFPKLPGAPLKALQRYSAISRQIRQMAPDVVVATGARAVWVVSAAIRSALPPWVAIGHGSEFTVVPAWERALARRSFNRASAIIAVSRFTLGLIHDCGIQPAISHVIPNGADDGLFRRLPGQEVMEFRRALGYSDGPLLLTVGNVTDRKGQEIVIRAMPEILKRHPGARYLMAGLPTERPKMEQIARELAVDGHVRFLGRMSNEDVVRLMNAADIFLLTSRTTATGDCEGFGIAVIEAALCGKASIVSRGSGLAEAVLDMETGITVPEGNSAAVAEAACRLLDDSGFRERLAAAAEQRAMESLTWDRVISRYEAVFQELIGTNAVATRGTKPA